MSSVTPLTFSLWKDFFFYLLMFVCLWPSARQSVCLSVDINYWLYVVVRSDVRSANAYTSSHYPHSYNCLKKTFRHAYYHCYNFLCCLLFNFIYIFILFSKKNIKVGVLSLKKGESLCYGSREIARVADNTRVRKMDERGDRKKRTKTLWDGNTKQRRKWRQ